jgi:urease accessory protein
MTRISAFLVALVAVCGAAEAHVGQHSEFSALDGFLHPLLGLDHLTAMLAVGLWSAQGGGRRLFAWPLAFIAAMVIGGTIARTGLPVPLVEPSIAASLVVFGILVLLALRAPVLAGAALIVPFAMAHGFAHGAEAPANGWAGYAAGFAASTALVHAVGIGIGRACVRLSNATPLRVLGLVPIAVGIATVLK